MSSFFHIHTHDDEIAENAAFKCWSMVNNGTTKRGGICLSLKKFSYVNKRYRAQATKRKGDEKIEWIWNFDYLSISRFSWPETIEQHYAVKQHTFLIASDSIRLKKRQFSIYVNLNKKTFIKGQSCEIIFCAQNERLITDETCLSRRRFYSWLKGNSLNSFMFIVFFPFRIFFYFIQAFDLILRNLNIKERYVMWAAEISIRKGRLGVVHKLRRQFIRRFPFDALVTLAILSRWSLVAF